MATEEDIREGLLSYLAAEVQAVQAGVQTERRFRQIRGLSRSQRLDLMGQDLYYLEVLPTGIALTDPAPDDSLRQREYSYTATLFFRYEDADTYAASSQATWDPIAQAMIEALAEGSYTDNAGRRYVETTDLTLDIQPLDEAFQDVVHSLTATITVTDTPA